VSLACRICPHALCGGTFADDSKSCVIVFEHGGYFFEWKAHRDPRFSDVVARAVHANVRLRCQSWELAIKSPRIIAPPHQFPLDTLSLKIGNLKGCA
jgi:hypothetical protein